MGPLFCYWKSPITILGTSGYEIQIFLQKNAKPFANSEDPDQSDLGLHCVNYPFRDLQTSMG